jgi:hypothetical protein
MGLCGHGWSHSSVTAQETCEASNGNNSACVFTPANLTMGYLADATCAEREKLDCEAAGSSESVCFFTSAEDECTANTGYTFTQAACSNGGDRSSEAACLRTGNVYTHPVTAVPTRCNSIYTPFLTGNVSTEGSCEWNVNATHNLSSGFYYYPAVSSVVVSCSNGGDSSSHAACELTGNTYTPPTCKRANQPDLPVGATCAASAASICSASALGKSACETKNMCKTTECELTVAGTICVPIYVEGTTRTACETTGFEFTPAVPAVPGGAAEIPATCLPFGQAMDVFVVPGDTQVSYSYSCAHSS